MSVIPNEERTWRYVIETTREVGGCTYPDPPSFGYMVSVPGNEVIEDEAVLDRMGLSSALLCAYIDAREALLGLPHSYLGTWVGGGKLYLDVSVHVAELKDAIALGKTYNQWAIYDIAAGESISLGVRNDDAV